MRGGHQTASTAQCLEDPEVQVAVFAIVQDDAAFWVQTAIVSGANRKTRHPVTQCGHEGMSLGCACCIHGPHEHDVPLEGLRARPVVVLGEGGSPPYTVLCQPPA